MSRRCESVCGREQTPSTQSGSHRNLSGGGRTRSLSRHIVESPHPGVTRWIVADALNNWLIKGRRTDLDGRQSWHYLSYAPTLERLVRVVVSIDEATIVSAFQDRNATRAWNRGDRSYFARVYDEVEMRDESATSV